MMTVIHHCRFWLYLTVRSAKSCYLILAQSIPDFSEARHRHKSHLTESSRGFTTTKLKHAHHTVQNKGLDVLKNKKKKPQQAQTGLQAVKLMKPCLCKMLFQCGKWNPKSYSIHQAGNGTGCHWWALGQPELPPDCCQTWWRRSSLLCLHKYAQIVPALT